MPLDTLLDVPAWCNVGQGSFSFGDKGEVVCSPFFFSGTQVGSRVRLCLPGATLRLFVLFWLRGREPLCLSAVERDAVLRATCGRCRRATQRPAPLRVPAVALRVVRCLLLRRMSCVQVVEGNGRILVLAVGAFSTGGKISKLLQDAKVPPSLPATCASGILSLSATLQRSLACSRRFGTLQHSTVQYSTVLPRPTTRSESGPGTLPPAALSTLSPGQLCLPAQNGQLRQ
jgi:hypothetical protein